MVKYCMYCGKEIDDDSIFCPYCSKKLETSASVTNVSSKVSVSGGSNSSNIDISFLRVMASSRLFLYNIFTLGLYQIYWFFKNNKILRDGFNKDVNVVLRTIGIFIPIVNWFMYYFMLRDFRDLLEERNLESYSLVANFIFIVILPVFGLNIFALLNVQEYINDLCMYEDPSIKINRKYSGTEIALMLIVGILIIIGLIFALILMLSPLFMFL